MKTKWNLTKSDQRVHSENAERLKSGGVALGIEKTASSEPPRLRVEQKENSFIHAGVCKGIAVEFYLRLMPLKPGIILCDGGITISGCDDVDIPLVEPWEGSLRYNPFGWLDIESGSVLNHLVFNGRPLLCSRVFEGTLVAQSFDTLPSHFQTGTPINATICLVDQFDNPYESVVKLGVLRHSQEWERPKNATGLFGPKQVFGDVHQRRIHEHPTIVIGKTVSTVKGNAGGKSRQADSTGRHQTDGVEP